MITTPLIGTDLTPYEPPAIAWTGDAAQSEPWLWWVVFVFSYLAALTWAGYCIAKGGSPTIDWSWYRWKVSCYR